MLSSDNDDESIVNEINMTPLVDVMLVLLIIFIVTLPVIKHALPIDLPDAKSQPAASEIAFVEVAITGDGQLYWQGKATSLTELETHLQLLGQQTSVPELRVYADKQTRYETVMQVLSSAQQRGVHKIGLLTQPK